MGNKVDFKKIIGVIIAIVTVVLLVLLVILYIKENPNATKGKTEVVSTNNEFNEKWTRYSGLRTGVQVQAMITAMVENVNENKKDATKLIDLAYQAQEQGNVVFINSTVKTPNSSSLENAKSEINSKKNYQVEFVYSDTTGNISGIIVKADKNKIISFEPKEN